jgi:hypothetical protein
MINVDVRNYINRQLIRETARVFAREAFRNEAYRVVRDKSYEEFFEMTFEVFCEAGCDKLHEEITAVLEEIGHEDLYFADRLVEYQRDRDVILQQAVDLWGTEARPIFYEEIREAFREDAARKAAEPGQR